MNFTSLELSKKLVALGCKSCSEWWPEEYVFKGEERIPAFCLEDFVGTHEQAWENSKKVFGDVITCGCTCCGYEYGSRIAWEAGICAMIQSGDWRASLEKAVDLMTAVLKTNQNISKIGSAMHRH